MKFEDNCVEGSRLVSIADQIKTVARRFDDHKLPTNHACIVIWSGTDFSGETEERKNVLALDDSYLEDKVAVLARELKRFERALMVTCGSAAFYGQGPSWERIMMRTRTMFDLLDVATCDGYSLYSNLTQYRVKSMNGSATQWYSNYTGEPENSHSGDRKALLSRLPDADAERVREGRADGKRRRN